LGTKSVNAGKLDWCGVADQGKGRGQWCTPQNRIESVTYALGHRGRKKWERKEQRFQGAFERQVWVPGRDVHGQGWRPGEKRGVDSGERSMIQEDRRDCLSERKQTETKEKELDGPVL